MTDTDAAVIGPEPFGWYCHDKWKSGAAYHPDRCRIVEESKHATVVSQRDVERYNLYACVECQDRRLDWLDAE